MHRSGSRLFDPGCDTWVLPTPSVPFGHDLVEELVNWLNEMDTSYRDDLRDLNELNFARFDAKLEQRASELDAKMDRVAGKLDAKIDRFASELDAKMDRVAGKLDAKIDRFASDLDKKIDLRTAELRRDMAAQRANLITWMFVFWAGTVVPLAGLMLALFNHLRP
jgi:hypothetical protein